MTPAPTTERAREIAEAHIIAEFGSGWLVSGRAERLAELLIAAETRGAELMRERAAQCACDPKLFSHYTIGPLALSGGIAAAIRALPSIPPS